jgi:hypothetical protein
MVLAEGRPMELHLWREEEKTQANKSIAAMFIERYGMVHVLLVVRFC